MKTLNNSPRDIQKDDQPRASRTDITWTFLCLDDGRAANVVELSRTHLNVRLTGALPKANDEISGVLTLSGPEIPISGRILRVQGDRMVIVLDLLLDEFATVLEGYLTRVQMFDFLV